MLYDTLARKCEAEFGRKVLDIEQLDLIKYEDCENEITWWLFDDGSAIGLDMCSILHVRDDFNPCMRNL